MCCSLGSVLVEGEGNGSSCSGERSIQRSVATSEERQCKISLVDAAVQESELEGGIVASLPIVRQVRRTPGFSAVDIFVNRQGGRFSAWIWGRARGAVDGEVH